MISTKGILFFVSQSAASLRKEYQKFRRNNRIIARGENPGYIVKYQTSAVGATEFILKIIKITNQKDIIMSHLRR